MLRNILFNINPLIYIISNGPYISIVNYRVGELPLSGSLSISKYSVSVVVFPLFEANSGPTPLYYREGIDSSKFTSTSVVGPL